MLTGGHIINIRTHSKYTGNFFSKHLSVLACQHHALCVRAMLEPVILLWVRIVRIHAETYKVKARSCLLYEKNY